MNIQNYIEDNHEYFYNIDIINPTNEDILLPMINNINLKGVIYELDFNVSDFIILNYIICDYIIVDQQSKLKFNILLNNNIIPNLINSSIPICVLYFYEIKIQVLNLKDIPSKLIIKAITFNNSIRQSILDSDIIITDEQFKFKNGILVSPIVLTNIS